MKCAICKEKEAILVVPQRIYYDCEGNPIMRSREKIPVCKECFWRWAEENIGREKQLVSYP